MYLYLLAQKGLIPPASTTEYAVFFVLSFLTLVMENVFIGVICASQSEADPLDRAYKARMDQLNDFLMSMNVPVDLRDRAREYVRFTKELAKRQSYNELYEVRGRATIELHIREEAADR